MCSWQRHVTTCAIILRAGSSEGRAEGNSTCQGPELVCGTVECGRGEGSGEWRGGGMRDTGHTGPSLPVRELGLLRLLKARRNMVQLFLILFLFVCLVC